MTARPFELLVTGARRPVTWTGVSGEDAARRYADCHPGATVTAWREPRHGFYPGVDPRRIIG